MTPPTAIGRRTLYAMSRAVEACGRAGIHVAHALVKVVADDRAVCENREL